MKILIVDDEALARARLRELLKSQAGVEHCLEAEHGVQALELLAQQAIDLVILDIRMPRMDGLETALHIGKLNTPPAIIFCTAFEEHALKAFELHAVDYLLKPVKRERLAGALERAAKMRGQKDMALQSAVQSVGRRTQLSAKMRGELRLVPIREVLYLQADTKYVEVHSERDTVLIEDSLVQLEEEFAELFVRIHRNCLVAKTAILGLHKSALGEVALSVRNRPEKLEVSRRNVSAVRKLMKSL